MVFIDPVLPYFHQLMVAWLGDVTTLAEAGWIALRNPLHGVIILENSPSCCIPFESILRKR
jgi:hypothetical protein